VDEGLDHTGLAGLVEQEGDSGAEGAGMVGVHLTEERTAHCLHDDDGDGLVFA